MKKRRVYRGALLLLLFCCMVFSSTTANASAKTTYKKAVSYYKKGKYKSAQKYFNKLPQKANEACVKKMSSKMKKAYRKIVKKYNLTSTLGNKPYLYGYYLTDIDKDKKPELLVSYAEYETMESSMKTVVYTFKNGKAKKVGSFYSWSFNFYYDPRGNGMTIMYARQGGEEIYGMKLSGETLTKTKSWGTRWHASASDPYTAIPYSLDNHVTVEIKNGSYQKVVDLSPLKYKSL